MLSVPWDFQIDELQPQLQHLLGAQSSSAFRSSSSSSSSSSSNGSSHDSALHCSACSLRRTGSQMHSTLQMQPPALQQPVHRTLHARLHMLRMPSCRHRAALLAGQMRARCHSLILSHSCLG